MKPKEKFDFSRQFQDKLLALLFQDKILLAGYVDLLEATHFDGRERIVLAEWLFEFYKEYNEIPSRESLDEIVRNSNLKQKAKESALKFYDEVIAKVSSKALANREYIRDSLTEFVKYQSVVSALLQAKDMVEGGQVGDVEELMAQAFVIGTDMDLGHFFEERLLTRVKERKEAKDNPEEEFVVPLGIPKLDAALDGGMRAGELGVWGMAPGVGKSMALIHCAKIAILNGLFVVFYSLELYSGRLENRFDATFSGIPTKELADKPKTLRKRLRELWSKAGGELLLKYAPMNSYSLNAMDSHLMRVVEEVGETPDLICVDYADVMLPVFRRKEKRHELSEIYAGLRKLGLKYGCPIWTASQVTRASLEKDFVDMDDIAEDWGKVGIADFMICGWRSREATGDNLITLHVAKNRNGESGIVFDIETNYVIGTFHRSRR